MHRSKKRHAVCSEKAAFVSTREDEWNKCQAAQAVTKFIEDRKKRHAEKGMKENGK